MQAEIRHYRAICHRADTPRRRSRPCASSAPACSPTRSTPSSTPARVLPCLTDAIAYVAYPDAADVMDRLRAAGLAIGVVSNWDVSLHDALERIGLAPLVDAVVTSAEAGSSKPEPAIFERAGELLGARPHRMLHVGDDPEGDVDGARAAHLHAVLLVRGGTPRHAAAPDRDPARAAGAARPRPCSLTAASRGCWWRRRSSLQQAVTGGARRWCCEPPRDAARRSTASASAS